MVLNIAIFALFVGAFTWLWGIWAWCNEMQEKLDLIQTPWADTSTKERLDSSYVPLPDYKEPTKLHSKRVKTADQNAIKKDALEAEKEPRRYS